MTTIPEDTNGGWLSGDGRTFVECEAGAAYLHYDSSHSPHNAAALCWIMQCQPEVLPAGRTTRDLEMFARGHFFSLGFVHLRVSIDKLTVTGNPSPDQKSMLEKFARDSERVLETGNAWIA
ncbi:MAG: hypothetical protein RIQ93_2860 [Verrucomicrobiota bacterium]